MPGLTVEELSAGYNTVPVLHSVSFSLTQGKTVALIGRNGVGKTTLASTLAGLLPATSGSVRLGPVDITAEAPSQRVRRGLRLAPQERAVFQQLTVAENLEVAGLSAVEIGRALALFPDSLQGRENQTAGTLSGGEQKMLAVARTLTGTADILILDEPAEGLQPSNVDLLGNHLERARAAGKGLLLIEQHLALAHRLSDRFLVMERGEIVDRGRAGDPEIGHRIEQRLVI